MLRHLLTIFGVLLLLPLPAQNPNGVYTVESVPDPKQYANGYVSDPSGVLTEDARLQLNLLLRQLEQNATAQIAVVVLPSIGDEVPKDFATRLFEHWGIGQQSVDNGLLILTVMDQRRTEMETGYGLEAVLPDVICYRILMEELVPHFQQGDYSAGMIAAVLRVKTLLEDPEALAEIRAEADPYRNWPYFFGKRIFPPLYYYGWLTLLVMTGLLTWVVVTLSNKEELYDKYRHIRYATSWAFIVFFPVPYIILYIVLRRLLKRLRNQPRFSKVNGQPMQKLSETADDNFLEKGQLIEEEVGSVDYDVWVSEDGTDVLILPYHARASKYQRCPKCNYRACIMDEAHVVLEATYSRPGMMELVSDCKNCHYQQRKKKKIPQKTRSSSGSGFSGGGGGGGSWGGGSSGGGGSGASW